MLSSCWVDLQLKREIAMIAPMQNLFFIDILIPLVVFISTANITIKLTDEGMRRLIIRISDV